MLSLVASALAVAVPSGAQPAAIEPTATQPAATTFYWSGKNSATTSDSRAALSPYVGPHDLSQGPKWSFKLPHVSESNVSAAFMTTPLIDSDLNIYVQSRSGTLRKFSNTGEELWMYQFEEEDLLTPSGNSWNTGIPTSSMNTGIVAYNGLIYSLATSGYAFAFNTDGEVVWKSRVGSMWTAQADCPAPAAGHGMVVIAAVSQYCYEVTGVCMAGGGDLIVALDAADGSFLWEFNVTAHQYNAMPVFTEMELDGAKVLVIVFNDQLGSVYTLKAADGSLLWVNTPPDAVDDAEDPEYPSFTTGSAVVGPNGIVYAASNVGVVQWSDEGSFLFGNGTLSAYNLVDGSLVWRRTSPGPQQAMPTGGAVPTSPDSQWPCNAGGAVGMINSVKGRTLAYVVPVGGNPDFPWLWLNTTVGHPTVGRNNTARAAHTAALAAFDAATGETLWQYAFPIWYGATQQDHYADMCGPDGYDNPTLDADGVAYIGHESGFVYAIADYNGDGIITKEEVSSYDLQSGGFQGTAAFAPGMMAITSCYGVHVY